MDNNSSYRSLKREILAYELKLGLCDEAIAECDNSWRTVETKIEEQFALLLNTLAARKAALLQDVALRVNLQKTSVEETRGKLKASVEALKRILSTGEATYTVSVSTAENVWKSVTNMPAFNVNKESIAVTFSSQLLELVQHHGSVGDNRFLDADTVTTFAGSTNCGQQDGAGLHAKFSNLWGLAFNPTDGCLYAADLGNSIRKISIQSQEVSTFVSTTSRIHSFTFNYLQNCMFATNQSILGIDKFTATGIRSHAAGNGTSGNTDGDGEDAQFSYPIGITIDPKTSNLYVCDESNHLIRELSPEGEVSTLAGSQPGFADGIGKGAKFQHPNAVCYAEQSLLVCDYSNNKIRRVLFNGEVTTVCEIPRPRGIAVCKSNTIFISSAKHKIYQVIPVRGLKYEVKVLAGDGVQGNKDGKPLESRFNYPTGIAVHEPSNSIFVADIGNFCIRRISFAN